MNQRAALIVDLKKLSDCLSVNKHFVSPRPRFICCMDIRDPTRIPANNNITIALVTGRNKIGAYVLLMNRSIVPDFNADPGELVGKAIPLFVLRQGRQSTLFDY